LVVVVSCCLALALLAAERPAAFVPPARGGTPFWMVGPLRGLAPWAPHGQTALMLVFSALLLALSAGGAAAIARARELRTRAALLAIAAVHGVLLLSPPLPLTDIFNYL